MPANFDLNANIVADYNIYPECEENKREKESSGYWCLVCGKGFEDLHAYTAHNELLHEGKTAWSASLKTAPRASTSRDSSQPLLPIPSTSSSFVAADVSPEHVIGGFDAPMSSTPPLAPITAEGGIYIPFATEDGFEYAYSGIVDESAVFEISEWESVRVDTARSTGSQSLEKAEEENRGNEALMHRLASAMEDVSVSASEGGPKNTEAIPTDQDSPVQQDQPLPNQQKIELAQNSVQTPTPALAAAPIAVATTAAEEVWRSLCRLTPSEVPVSVAGYQSHWHQVSNIQIDESSAQMAAAAVARINTSRVRSTLGTGMLPTTTSSRGPLSLTTASSGMHTRYSPYTVPYHNSHHTSLHSSTSTTSSNAVALHSSLDPGPVPNLATFTSLEIEADKIRGEVTRYRELREGMEDTERQ